VKSWIRIRKIQELERLKNGGMGPVVADSNHFDEEQDPDPHPSDADSETCKKV
jgi:hypothetical protein